MLGVAALALSAVLFSLYLRSQQKEIASLIGICAVTVLFGAVLPGLAQATEVITRLGEGSGYDESVQILLKALGLGTVAGITADICRQAGENTVAMQVELFARIEIVLLSLPLATRLIELAREMLG